MYVSKKDLEVIRQLSAMVDGALEGADDTDGTTNVTDYWMKFSKEANDLLNKMKRHHYKSKPKN